MLTALPDPPSSTHRQRLLSVDIVASRLNVSPSTVRRLCSSGQLRAGLVGGQWRIAESDFRRYWEELFGPGAQSDPEIYRKR